MLIDVGQGAFHLSWFDRTPYSNDDQVFVTVLFIEDINLVNEKEFFESNYSLFPYSSKTIDLRILVSKKSNTTFQFNQMKNLIPTKTRHAYIKFSCTLNENMDQYFVFDRVKWE